MSLNQPEPLFQKLSVGTDQSGLVSLWKRWKTSQPQKHEGVLIYYPDSLSHFVNKKIEILRSHVFGPKPHGGMPTLLQSLFEVQSVNSHS